MDPLLPRIARTEPRGVRVDPFESLAPGPLNAHHDRLSRSVEDYLKAVFTLTEAGPAASTSALAGHLDVQPSSVTGMVKRLAEMGFLEHVPYRGVSLTPDGEREALRVIRRHRILETYLTDCLDYTWDDVHQEAERLEHAASDRLIEAMARALGDPSHDPHGAPIPTIEGEVEARPTRTLAQVPPGGLATLWSVPDEHGDELRLLAAHGLRPGVRIRVTERGDEGDLTLELVGGELPADDPVPAPVRLPGAVAERVYVGPPS